MSIFKSAFTVSFYISISRIFGFIRDIFIANFIGASYLSDVFFAAFRLPNFFRRVFGEGALNSAFVPVFIEKIQQDDEGSKKVFAQNIFSILFYSLLILVLIFQIFMPAFLATLFPGFKSDPEKFLLLVDLSRITIFYLIAISLVSLCSSILNSLGNFSGPASAPIILNVTLILSFFTLGKICPNYAYSLSWAVFAAGIFQFIYLMIFTIKRGIFLYPKLPTFKIFKDKSVKKFFKKLLPAIIGGNVMQINLLVDSVFASLFAGALSYLYYADRINQLPLAMVGIAIGIVLLPAMTRKIQSGDEDEAIKLQNYAIEVGLLFIIPASVALICLAHPIITTLFERGEFSSEDSYHVSKALQIYAMGLPAYVSVKIMDPGFFARGNTKTPMKIALFCLFSNLVFNFTFYFNGFSYTGIAFSSVLSSYINLSLLAFNLIKKKQFKFTAGIFAKLFKIFVTSLFMAAILMLLSRYFYGSDKFNIIVELFFTISAGIISYFSISYFVGSLDPVLQKNVIKKSIK